MSEHSVTHSSEIQTAIARLRPKNNLIGYRNLLSYVNTLNLHIFPTTKINRHLWASKGSGTYSEVFETRLDGEPPKEIIIKRPNASFTRDDERVENFVQHQALSNIVQEVRILTHPGLSYHDNLIHIFGIYLEEEDNPVGTRPCIVFEKALMTLSTYLRHHAVHLCQDSVITFVSDLTAGISAVHAHGLVHGDLKPDNVLMVLRHGRLTCALADFGTSGTSGQSVKEYGVIPGTPGFRAPENYESSDFRHWVNMPARDVYGLGLIVYSIITNDRAPPFPSDSEELQHDDVACLAFLRGRGIQTLHMELPWEVIQHCVRANPEARCSLTFLRCLLKRAQGLDGENSEIEDLAQSLLTNPPDPRVRFLDEIKPSSHLRAKLLAEYELACDGEIDGRLAMTMAALYAGIIGTPVERPFNFVAKAQWLLKAIEFGHTPAIIAVHEDPNTFKITETFGRSLLLYRRPSFKSPTISAPLLLKRLKEAAVTGNTIALNLLVFLGGEIPDHMQFNREISPSANSLHRKLYEAFPALDQESYFEEFLQRDLQIMDSDAIDLMAARTESQGLKCAYNNDIEGFIQAAETLSEIELRHALEYAILGGSSNVVRYILGHFHLDPNGALEESSSEADWMSLDTDEEEEEEGGGGEKEESEEKEDSVISQDEFEPQSEGDEDESSSGSVPNFHLFEPLKDMRSFETALVLGRPSVVQAFIQNGAKIIPASGHKPSSLHFLARFDDEKLVATVCGSCADKTVLREIMESKPSTGPMKDISALDINMYARRWRNVMLMIQLANGGFSRQTASMLLLTAVSQMNPAPPSVLSALLNCGSDPNIAHQSAQPPLYWAIGTSNVLATAILLSHGADVSLPGDTDLEGFAQECMDEINYYSGVEVYNEQGEMCVGGLQRMRVAARTVYELMLLARKREENWKTDIGKCVEECPNDCRGKVWRADKTDPAEATMLLEICYATADEIYDVEVGM